jgi:hypothetical protein
MREDEIVHSLKELERRISKLEAVFQSGGREPNLVKISQKEFLISTNAKDDVQKTLALGYFIEKFEGIDCFTVKDLQRGFMMAKEIPPANINDKLTKNMVKEFIMETQDKKDNKKAWCLTNSGQEYVETVLLQKDLRK